MIDSVTRQRWDREDERDQWRHIAFLSCPECGYVFHVDATVRGDGQPSCPSCYAVLPVPKGDE